MGKDGDSELAWPVTRKCHPQIFFFKRVHSPASLPRNSSLLLQEYHFWLSRWALSESCQNFQSIISSSIKAQLDSISYFGTITWWQNYCLSLSDIAMKVFLAQTARLRPTPNARHSPTTSTKISRWNSSGPHNANVEMAFFTLIHSHFFQTRILMFTSKASA